MRNKKTINQQLTDKLISKIALTDRTLTPAASVKTRVLLMRAIYGMPTTKNAFCSSNNQRHNPSQPMTGNENNKRNIR